MIKYKIIQVKVNDEQFEKISTEAKVVGLPRTAFTRFLILKNLKSLEASTN